MTSINTDQLAQIEYVDQALVWAIVTLQKANKHPENLQLSDNAAIRQESRDFCNWNITRNSEGVGTFFYSAILPIVNPDPLMDRESIIQCIASYTSFLVPDNEVTYPTDGKGMRLPPIPAYVNTLEKLVYWLVRLVEIVNQIIVYANKLIAQKQSLEGGLDVVYDAGTGFIATPEIITSGFLIEGVGNENTAEGIIAQFDGNDDDGRGVPDWYMQGIGLSFYEIKYASEPINLGGGNDKGKRVETLPVCKEQDPNVTAYGENNLYDILTKK
jgi:hypothetical protein